MFSGLTPTDMLFIFLSLLIGVTLHEMMHGRAAYWLGDTTAADMGRLTLNPLASIDPFTTILLPLLLILTVGVPFFAAKPVPFNPARLRYDEFGGALVGVAGPATNLVLALVGAGLYHLFSGASHFFYWFVVVNVGLMVFNLIPFPPLDGSRVLYALAPEPVQEFMASIERLGFVAILIFIFLVFETGIGTAIGNIDLHIINWLLGV